jgi:hypothetical protein
MLIEQMIIFVPLPLTLHPSLRVISALQISLLVGYLIALLDNPDLNPHIVYIMCMMLCALAWTLGLPMSTGTMSVHDVMSKSTGIAASALTLHNHSSIRH